ncbi:rhodanese-related sulfurtransferase [Candidatus Peregrinibacteria bacterium]|nr:MAG: rhodanese-related sulfurtransferase [Candidatus Peregrinibacteria bacterium]
MPLYNKYSKEDCLKRLRAETFERKTVSFYRYVQLEDVNRLRDELYRAWAAMGVLGRIYVATEGINAQISVPMPQWDVFVKYLYSFKAFEQMPFKVAVEDDESFWKLAIKVKKQIVADGLPAGEYDITNVGKHLDAESFNEAMEEGATVVDMRNQYESRIGHFEGAITPDVDTFKEELVQVKEMLKGKENEKVLLYCTGGVRCEKTSAYLKHHGFKDVNQLHGGIIQYAHEVKQKGLSSKYKGANYVFDGRTAERITDDVLTHCDQCQDTCDQMVNCKNVMCNLLFVQCNGCGEKMSGCCSENCKEIIALPIDEQRQLRKRQKPATFEVYRKRVRPNLKDAKPVYEMNQF